MEDKMAGRCGTHGTDVKRILSTFEGRNVMLFLCGEWQFLAVPTR